VIGDRVADDPPEGNVDDGGYCQPSHVLANKAIAR
jgi:hypothetical protein